MFGHLISAICTPFDEDNKIDFDTFLKLLKKVEEKLLQYEDNLKLMSIKGTLKSLLEESDIEVIKNKLNKII